MAAFRKRPPFSSVEEYEKFMKDPTRVVRLEWRKARRQQHKGLTSHSWLDAELLEGERLRLEFFADTGLTESLFAAGKGERESTLYENRVAGPGDFSRPLTAKLLRRVAEKAAVKPYSLTDWNCHHFVLEVWNSVVIAVLRRSHYPDRVKTNVLWGASETVGKLWTNLMTRQPEQRSLVDERGDNSQPGPLGRMLLGSLSSNAGIDMADSADRTPLTRTRSTASSLPQSRPSGDLGEDVGGDSSPDNDISAGSRHVTLQAHQEEGDRISGEVEAVPNLADEDERNWQFSRAVQEGNIFLLSTENGLVTADLPAEAQRTRHAWAEAWLPFLGSAGLRMADHLGCTDSVELVVRVLGNDGAQAVARQRQREVAARTPFASLNSESLASNGGERSRVTSSCFVVLLGSEIRLVVYATLGSKPARRLRLLSGNLHEWRESSFTYTLMETSPEQPVGGAKEWLKEELESLRFALSTGDWGFVTLL